jgi:RNA polymerase sigma factor (sigma-70 family)
LGELEDRDLIELAREGDPASLEALLRNHQGWVYNLALRMVGNTEEAEDLCQEILIKAFLRISTFEGRSSFRAWLYRIAVNQLLTMRESRQERENRTSSAPWDNDAFVSGYLESAAIDHKTMPPDLALVAAEVKAKCLLGMLMCLGRRQRLVYILGDMLMVGSRAGSAILGVSEESYRQILSRARRRLRTFIGDRCSLLNPGKPCTCELSAMASSKSGYIDPFHLVFKTSDAPTIRQKLGHLAASLDAIVLDECQALFLDLPFQDSPEFTGKMLKVIQGPNMRAVLDMDRAN